MKHKRYTYYTHNHRNLMKQSHCLSLIPCKDIQCRKKVSFPQSPRSYQKKNPNSSLFSLFYAFSCLCPFVFSSMLALWLPPQSLSFSLTRLIFYARLTLRLPTPWLLLSIRVFQYSQDALNQWEELSHT